MDEELVDDLFDFIADEGESVETIQCERQHTAFGKVLRGVCKNPKSQSLHTVAAHAFTNVLIRDHDILYKGKKSTCGTLRSRMKTLKQLLKKKVGRRPVAKARLRKKLNQFPLQTATQPVMQYANAEFRRMREQIQIERGLPAYASVWR